MPHNHQCYTLGNHCAEFHPIPSVDRNQCKFPIPYKSPFLDIYLSYRPETKGKACLAQITPSKFDEICN